MCSRFFFFKSDHHPYPTRNLSYFVVITFPPLHRNRPLASVFGSYGDNNCKQVSIFQEGELVRLLLLSYQECCSVTPLSFTLVPSTITLACARCDMNDVPLHSLAGICAIHRSYSCLGLLYGQCFSKKRSSDHGAGLPGKIALHFTSA
jgi:hypothetical protein